MIEKTIEYENQVWEYIFLDPAPMTKTQEREVIYQVVVMHNNKERKKSIRGTSYEGLINKIGFAQLVGYYGTQYNICLDIEGQRKPLKIKILMNDNNQENN